MPLMSKPATRSLSEIKLYAVPGYSRVEMQVKIDLPNDFAEKHLVMMLRMRAAKRLQVGPIFLLFVKIVDMDMD